MRWFQTTYKQGLKDAAKDWEADTIKSDLPTETVKDRAYLEAYSSEIKRLSLIPENKGC